MANSFFEKPILNSPYACPQRNWELDGEGQPTQRIKESRRRADFIMTHGRWAFAEFTDVYEMQEDFAAKVAEHFDRMIAEVTT